MLQGDMVLHLFGMTWAMAAMLTLGPDRLCHSQAKHRVNCLDELATHQKYPKAGGFTTIYGTY